MTNYIKQGNDFLEKNKIEIDISLSHTGKHFDGDKEARDIYNITFKRKGQQFSIVFGASINDTLKREAAKNLRNLQGDYIGRTEVIKILQECKPTAYCVLACLQKYEVGDLDDFLSEYGYTIEKAGDLRRLQRLHLNVYEEFDKVRRFFTSEELEELKDIN